MTLKKLYDPSQGQMRVVGLMSGKGSNIRKIIEYERKLGEERGESPYHVAVIFTDDITSKAVEIGKDYDLPVVTRDKRGFYAARGKPLGDMQVREEFDRENVIALSPYNVTVAAYGGYMSKATKPLINAFLGVNVHPADLSILRGDGKRKFRGGNAVRDAILAGEKFIRASTHIIEEEVDDGRLLMVSQHHEVVIPAGFDKYDCAQVKEVTKINQDALKEKGDWIIFPKTLEHLADGRFAQDEHGKLYFDEVSIPDGLRR